MTLVLGMMDLPVELTARTGPQCWNLFACCIPKPAPETEEEGDSGKPLLKIDDMYIHYISLILDKNSIFAFLSPY